jgi:hypothetical protein
VRGNTFFAGRNQVRRKKPFMKRNMGTLVKRADRGRERFLTAVAFVEAGTMAFAL